MKPILPSNKTIATMFDKTIKRYTTFSEDEDNGHFPNYHFCKVYLNQDNPPGCGECPLNDSDICFDPYPKWFYVKRFEEAKVILEIVKNALLDWRACK